MSLRIHGSLTSPSASSRPAAASAPKASATEQSVQIDTLEIPAVWQEGFTGEGVGIAVIDSGAAPHPDIRSRLVAFKDFVNDNGRCDDADPSLAYDDNGHGTAVSTIAAGDGAASEGRLMGVAPGASVIGLKAVGADGMAWSSQVVKAIQWAVDNKERYNIRVLNMSFYLDDVDPEQHKPVVQALEKAAEAGIIPVAAASNDGPSERTLHTIASYPHVVTVAAFDTAETVRADDDEIAAFSSRGPGDDGQLKPDVAAPGVDVIVGTPDGGYTRSSGTSFAAPMTAGVIATWLEANPSLTVSDVQAIIADTSRPMEGYDHYDQGFGQIRPLEGLHAALALKEQPATA